MRNSLAAIVAVLFAGTLPALAGTFTADIERTDPGTVVQPGQSISYVIRGTLTNEDANLGLALFLYNLEVTSAGLTPINLDLAVVQSHPAPDMDSFVLGFGGYSGDYNGTPIGDNLEQCGGSQNTIQNDPATPPFLPFPSGPVVENIGHGTGAILHQGTLTLPTNASLGQYTFRVTPGSVIANQVSTFDGFTYTVAPATAVAGSEITFQFGCTSDTDCDSGQTCNMTTGVCAGGGAVPTISQWGTITMTLLMLSAGTILFARRRVNTATE